MKIPLKHLIDAVSQARPAICRGIGMKSLMLQLKSTCRDKMCILSFLLPILMAIGINVIDTGKWNPSYELKFGCLQNSVSKETLSTLNQYGEVVFYPTSEVLDKEIIHPKNDIIGISEYSGKIQIKIAGDEPEYIRNAARQLQAMQDAHTLPDLSANTTVLPLPNIFDTYKDIFIVITLIIAMFMGCVYNAMNIISEKEDGIESINTVLPLNRVQYLVQKIMIGLAFCLLSSIITVLLCLKLTAEETVYTLVIILFSAFISALIGVLIGRIADGMLVGISIIKVVMLVFLVVPLISYFFMSDFKTFKWMFYIIPSTATFDGILSLMFVNLQNARSCVLILGIESVVCTVFFLATAKSKIMRNVRYQ